MRAAMYAKGIQIDCVPTADARDSWLATVRHIAVEGRCFVLSCNQFNRRRDLGHYSRPDIFQLHVDERPKKSVTVRGHDEPDPE